VAFSTGLQVAILTDVGMRRTTNQDSHALLLADSAELVAERGHLLLVADGMGAHAAGELASKLAADGVPHLYHKYTELPPHEALRRAILETNTEIHRRGSANPDFHNMGTTTSVLVLLPQGALLAHVGDSRVYRLRGNSIGQLTFDHSLQWELKASGQLPPGADVGAIVPKNVITRSLGPNLAVQVDLEGPHPIAVGDVYLLCSDGLTGRVSDAELGAILGSVPPDEAAHALIDLANLRGGPDNITVLIAKVTSQEFFTAGVDSEQPTPSRTRRQAVHPAIWIVAAVCALAALVMVLATQPPLQFQAAGIALAGAAIACLVGIVQKFGGFGGRRTLPTGRMLGNGPYTDVSCSPSRELIPKLSSTLDELREAARDGEWTIEWQPLEESCKQAVAASQSGNYSEAVHQFCRGISYVMKQLRSQHVKKTGDSAVRY
jgi:protein phosphatase